MKRQKNDTAEAEAICEAVTGPTMRFVPVKGEEQQGILMLHRTCELLIRQRTMLINALRGHLAEFGIVTAQGRAGVSTLVALVEDDEHGLIPTIAREALLAVVDQLRDAHERVATIERKIVGWHRTNEQSRRLETIPGIGPITASAIAATITDASLFRSGQELAAWIGLVPRQNSSGGKERLGHISKKGDPYIRRLLVIGAHAVLRFARSGKPSSTKWAAALSHGLHQGQRPYEPQSKAGHMTAPTMFAITAKNILPCGGRPHLSPKWVVFADMLSKFGLGGVDKMIDGRIVS